MHTLRLNSQYQHPMARLEPSDVPAPYRAPRYAFDRDRIVAWFGGEKRILELADTFGVPRPFKNRGITRLSAANLAVLLELAERMHRPIDLYQFLTESR